MKTTFKTITTIITLLFITINLKGQTLLSPADLMHAHKLSDSSINNMLKGSGYLLQHTQDINGQKTVTWHFQLRPGDTSDFYIIKSTSAYETTIRYWIMNMYFYKQFISALIKDNYKFTEVMIIDKECYSVFGKDKTQFLIAQKRVTGKADDYFEVMIQ